MTFGFSKSPFLLTFTTGVSQYSFCFGLNLVKLNLNGSPMAHAYTAINKLTRIIFSFWKNVSKNWKNVDFFLNSHFLEDFFGKTALNRGLALLSAVWKLHYTGDRTIWNRITGNPCILIFFIQTLSTPIPPFWGFVCRYACQAFIWKRK